jgi:CheY-like chemotaxis protein
MKTPPMDKESILLVDDEPLYMSWAAEYLQSKGYKIRTATSLSTALPILEASRFRVVIIDLSIPASEEWAAPLASKGPAYTLYPGLLLADAARNLGHRGRQVILYSAHDDPAVAGERDKLQCTYLLKGSPRRFKEELDEVLSYDPLP